VEGDRRNGPQKNFGLSRPDVPTGIHHFAIQVRDLGLAERFYCDVLGFPVVKRWPEATGAGHRSLWVDLNDNGAFLALERVTSSASTVAETPGARAQDPGHFLLAFRIQPSERTDWIARLGAAGVVITHQSAFTLYFSDPEGNRLGLSHHPVPALPAPDDALASQTAT